MSAVLQEGSVAPASPVAPAAPAVPADQGIESTADQKPELKEAPPNTPDGEKPPEEKHEPLPKGVQKRIDRAVRDKYEAQARTKMLEERLAAIEARQQQPQRQNERQTDAGEPTIDKYDNFDQYVAARSRWEAKQIVETTLAEREKHQAAERETAARQTTVEQWNQRVSKATAEMPDFEEVLASSEVPMTDAMQHAIMESERGPQLAYFLANNPDEATKIARMTPSGAFRTLGMIEERLSKPTERKPTAAPAPLTPIGTTAKVTKDPSSMSQEEFEKWRKSFIAKR